MEYDFKKGILTINLHDDLVDTIVEAKLVDAFHLSKDTYCNTHQDDKRYNKKLRKALKRVLQYYCDPGKYDDLEV